MGKSSESSNKIICVRCGSLHTKRNLYNSHSDLYKYIGVIPICKKCIGEIYNNIYDEVKDDELAIYRFCRKLDIPFNKSAYEAAKSIANKKGWNIYKTYITQINSIGGLNNYGKSFDDSDVVSESINNKNRNNNKQDIDQTEFEVTPEMVRFWGKGYTPEQYQFLTDFYESLISTYEHNTPIQINIYKNIAKAQLQADIALEQGRMTDYDKAMKTLSTLMNDGNIKPVQETGANAPEQATFGTLIKKWENEKPIPDPLKEWKDNNYLIKYITVWLFGHLCKMLNIPNDYAKLYEKEKNKYTVVQEVDDKAGQLPND